MAQDKLTLNFISIIQIESAFIELIRTIKKN